jgi:hypothetical protein
MTRAAAPRASLCLIHSLNTKQTISVNKIRSIYYEIPTVKEVQIERKNFLLPDLVRIYTDV